MGVFSTGGVKFKDVDEAYITGLLFGAVIGFMIAFVLFLMLFR